MQTIKLATNLNCLQKIWEALTKKYQNKWFDPTLRHVIFISAFGKKTRWQRQKYRYEKSKKYENEKNGLLRNLHVSNFL